MLAIRMQRTGRKGHANFRVIVQDSHRSPTSGKVVAFLGSYDPHTKAATIVKDKADFYLQHGAQPSNRVALLLKKEGVKLPKWVEIDTKKQGKLRHEEKLRKNRPAGAEAPEQPVDESPADEVATETVAEAPAEESAVETPTEEQAPETPTEEVAQAEASEEEAPATEEQIEPEESTDSKDKTA